MKDLLFNKIKYLVIGMLLISSQSIAANYSANLLYTIEMRGSGEKDIFYWKNNNDSLTFDKLAYVSTRDMEVQILVAANGYYNFSSAGSNGYLSANSGSEGTIITFKDADGSDDQLWQIVDKGDGFVELINKATQLAVSYSVDTNSSADHYSGDGILATNDHSNSTQWIIRISNRTPNSSIGVNQNGWAQNQSKQATLLTDTLIPPSYSVTGPQTISGTMTYWGQKWGHEFYTVDLTALTTPGHYTINANGISQNFSVIDDAFVNVRAETGGVISWQNIIDGHLDSQAVKAPGDTLDVAVGYDGVPDYTGDTYTLNGGFYDASSVDNKIYRTANIYQYLALAMLETSDSNKKAMLQTTVEDGLNWLQSTQNPDGSWPLGKVRVSGDDYYWSITTDPAGVARVVSSLAIISQALSSSNPTLATTAQQMAESGWQWVSSNSLDSDFVDPKGSFFGSQNNLIAAAIELYILTNDSQYKTYADTKINEATFSSGGIYKSSGTAWPGQATNRRADMIDGHLFSHLARYYAVADAGIKSTIEAQLLAFIQYWQTNYLTPWNIPENLGGPNISQGWARSIGTFALQVAYVAKETNWQDAKDLATACWDFLAGNNPYASNLFVGGRGVAHMPLWHQPWDKHIGAVVPGIIVENGVFTNDSFGYEFSETVSKDNIALITFWSLMAQMYPAQTANSAAEFYAPSFNVADGFLNEPYSYNLSTHSFDKDEDTLTYSKVGSDPTWISVASNGDISGTPLIANVGENQVVVELTDGVNAAVQSIIVINVLDSTTAAPNFAPQWDNTNFTSPDGTVNEPYLRWINWRVTDAESDPITFTKVAGDNWLTVNSNGKLEGTPTSSGTYVYTVSASDGINPAVEATMTIEVLPGANSAPMWNSDPLTLANADKNQAYNDTVADDVTDADGDILTFTLISGPSWLSMTSDGIISGTPRKKHVGISNVIIEVSDGVNPAVSVTATVNVSN